MSIISKPKPAELFGRESEWDALSRFVEAPNAGSRLGVVYGRRRQGKTVLLESLRDTYGGFYWQARQQSDAQNLASLSVAWTQFTSAAVPTRFADWDEAFSALARPPGDTPVPVLLDEVGYLVQAAPDAPSHLQAVLSPRGPARTKGLARLILCGSALGQMRKLLDADAPLRGRAAMELAVHPFSYRQAAEFWGLRANPDAAFRLHALVGGTPAYRDYASGDTPDDGDVDSWVLRNLLSSSSPLFREGRIVISEDPALSDQALYWGLLGAVAEGARRRGEITAVLNRSATSLSHALNVLADAGWITQHHDPLRDKRSTFTIAEPIVRFHRLVVEPNESRLLHRGLASQVWGENAPLIRSRVYGAHLEQLAIEWLVLHASLETLGGRARLVGSTEIRVKGSLAQVDLAAVESTTAGATRLLALGEVKAGDRPMELPALERLDEIAKARGGEPIKRILVSRSGFTGPLKTAVRSRRDVELVDLHRLYSGE